MPNGNTIERLVGSNSPAQGANALPSIAPTGTGATVVTNQLGNAGVLTLATGANLSAASSSPSFGVNFDGFPFKLRVCAKVTTTASANITVAIQQGTSATAGSNTTIATTGPVAVNTTSGLALLECYCIWDSIKQRLQGLQWGLAADGTAVATAALTSSPTVTTQGALQFVVAVTTSSANNATFAITEFTAEQA